MSRVRIYLNIGLFSGLYLRCSGCRWCRRINSLKSGSLYWVIFSRRSLVQLSRKAFRMAPNLASSCCFSSLGSSSIDVGWLMLAWLKGLVLSPSSSLLHMSQVDWIFFSFFPSGVNRKYVDAGWVPDHTPAGASMPKGLHTTHSAARM